MRTIVRILLIILLVFSAAASAVLADPREMVEQACRKYVIEQLQWNPEDVQIVFHSYVEPQLDWTGAVLHVTHPRNADLCGLVTLRVAAVNGGDTLRSFPVPAEITLYDEIVIARRRLRRGDVVLSGDVDVLRRPVNLGPDAPFSQAAEVVGCRTTRAVPIGRELTASAIEEIPLVKRGQRVTVRYESGNLLLTASAEAMEDGWAGRPVRLRNLSSKKMISGVPAGVGVVDVSGSSAGN